MRKTVLITGASRGIGFAIAKSLESEFENMILVARHKETLDKAAGQLKGPKIFKYVVDLEDEKELLKFAKEINKKFKSLDVLVNNAGVYIGRRFINEPTEEIIRILNLDLKCHILLTHELLPIIKKGKNPQIINISSHAVRTLLYGEAVYTAAKSAISSFSDVLRKELNDEGIRITAIEPGGVDTYPIPKPDILLSPLEIGEAVSYIIDRPATVQIDVLGLSHIKQWRGTKPGWIE